MINHEASVINVQPPFIVFFFNTHTHVECRIIHNELSSNIIRL